MQAIKSNRSVRSRTKQTSGRRHNQENQSQGDSRQPASPDFLKQCFLPISHNKACCNSKWEKVEQDFFSAATNLANLYKISFTADTTLDFPMNVATAYRILKEQLQKRDASLYIAITDNRKKTTLATIKPVRKVYDLFYVPLSALDEFHRARNNPCFDILLSVFAYLNQKAGLPLLSDNDYLTGCYDAISEWVTDSDHDMDEKEYNSSCADIRCMYKKIHILEKKVRDTTNLADFDKRIRSFKPGTATEKRFKSVARKIYRLFNEFPTANFYKNIHCDHLEEDEGERIYPDHYFSFFWDDHDWLHDHLMEYVNSDLQEMLEWEVPVSVQYFDRTQKEVSHQLPFETRLLTLMDELCAVLYRFHYEKHYR